MNADTKFRYWFTIAIAAHWKMDEGGYERPMFVGHTQTPETLDNLTFGQLIELSQLEGTNRVFYEICRIVLGMEQADVDEARAVEVVSFVGWLTEEVNKINKRFKRLSVKPTDAEVRAGIDKLNFGLFGLVDRYARRMHITNHDEVMAVSWVRVYRCIEMDNAVDEFQKRYMEVTQDDYRRKNSRSRK